MRLASLLLAVSVLAVASASAQPAAPAVAEYKILKKAPVGGTGGFDYVFADSVGRKLYIPRGNRVEAYDIDTLKSAGTIDNAAGVHGAAVDPVAKHAFCSSNPVVMWDTETLKIIKTIPVQGNPDGINFEPVSGRVYILSHQSPPRSTSISSATPPPMSP